MLKPYVEFENKVKEIVDIVKEADNIVRNQVRELEEQEREQKKEKVKDLFENKLKHYDFNKLINFNDFFKENMANKSTSIDKIENQISEWLEQRKQDITVIKSLNDTNNKILKEYLNSFNLAGAIEIVKREEIESKKIEEVLADIKTDKKYIFIISNEKDAKLTEMLLKENKINYIMEEK